MHADLKATFGDKKHELGVNTYQMCILMLFNDVDSLSFREIQETTGIPDGDLKRSLQSLACAKVCNSGWIRVCQQAVGEKVAVT